MRTYPVPANEEARLEALRALEIMGTSVPEFDHVVALACALFNVPIALVSFLDEHELWLKAAHGIGRGSIEREAAFCNHQVATGEPLIVDDAAADPRFSDNRLVTGSPGIRFYAGAPITLSRGIHIGSLCIIDTRPRELAPSEALQLSHLASLVTALVRQHRDSRDFLRLAYDWDEQNRSNRVLTESLVRHKSLFESASTLAKIGAWEWLIETDELTWTNGMYDIHEVPRGSPMTAEQVLDFYPPGTREQVQRLNAPTSDARSYSFEGPLVTGQGNMRWVRVTGGCESKDGLVHRRYGLKQDITEQKALWDRMQFLAECDPLTGLANRSTFQRRLRAMCKGRKRSLMLLLIDVDGFKHVNDTFGHAVGDVCLKRIARRLQRAADTTEMVSRLGGDEFALLTPTPDGHEAIVAYVEHILDGLRRPICWNGQSFQLSGSIGVALVDRKTDKPAHVFANADLALYAAKSAGKNTFRFFAPEMKAAADLRFETVRNITKALELRQLELFYQPKIRLDDLTLRGFEALLRWRKPDGNVVAAGAFSAALEDPTLSEHLDAWVLEAALSQARDWHLAGLNFGHIAVNLSASQFQQPGFAERLLAQMTSYGLSPSMIEVEVVEGVFLSHDNGIIKHALNSLRTSGIRIALDDFGTGYASLTHLRTFPVDVIKIDRSFVRDFLQSNHDHVILQSILFLGRHMNLDIVAEGIETKDQVDFLKALGCRYGQGYWFSKAVCADEAREWCRPAATIRSMSRRALS